MKATEKVERTGGEEQRVGEGKVEKAWLSIDADDRDVMEGANGETQWND